MIGWLERHKKVAWGVVVVIGVLIFVLSSIPAENLGSVGGSNINAIMYHIIAFYAFALFLFIAVTEGKYLGLVYWGVIIALAYGILDELHQLFVPGRVASVGDVFLDGVGIAFALVVYLIYSEMRKRRK
jgi:hypothetical protein